jgi:hypothetical protein
LKDVIDQIIQIDNLAYENKNKYDEALLNKKKEFESMKDNYQNEKLEAAQNNAKKIFESTESIVRENEKSYNDKINQISSAIDKKYQKAEKELVKKIFDKLFVLEG